MSAVEPAREGSPDRGPVNERRPDPDPNPNLGPDPDPDPNAGPDPDEGTGPCRDRGVSPVVGVVLLVGVTVLLAASTVAFVGFGEAIRDPAPRAGIDVSLSATDGWPDGQRLEVVHAGGDRLPVADLALVVDLKRVDASPRLTDFPTRRVAGDHVRGRDVVDGTYAGVDGPLDRAHTDGYWTAGETASLRVVQHEVDVRPGDRVTVSVVHRPTNTVVARESATATAS